MTGVEAEVTGLNEFITGVDRALAITGPEVRAVVDKGALNIKNDWRRRWSGLAHAPALPRAITYDVTYGLAGVKAEIGPDKSKRQGPLGNLLEYGSIHNAPSPGGLPALEAEAPRFERALADLAGRLLDPQ